MFISRTHRGPVMEWPIGPYGTIMAVILLSTIPLRNLLTRDEPEKRLSLSELPAEIRAKGYYWHISLYVVMYVYKFMIDQHNEPMKARVGGYTHWLYEIEGEFTLWFQDTFRNDVLTDILSFHYLFVYLFVIWFSPMYFILVRDHTMADKAALNYFVIYLLSVPLYLFFNVEVTSTYIPGMDALLYHDSWYLEFVTNNDPMDNGVPSLHFGLPVGLLILNRMHCRDKGISISEWRHREFDLFVLINLIVYFFSIQYLGIHWITDIVPGLILAVICAHFIHKWQPAIRARPENGWGSLIPKKQPLAIAVALTLALTSTLAFVAVDGSGSDDDLANMRLGPGDVKIDTIEVHSLSHPVEVKIENVGDPISEMTGPAPICIIVKRSDVVYAFERGELKEGLEFNDLLSHPHQGNVYLIPGVSFEAMVDTPSLFDTHLIICHSETPDVVTELRITMHYVDDELIWTAMILSIPAFLIAGLVLAQTVASEDEVGEQASDEES